MDEKSAARTLLLLSNSSSASGKSDNEMSAAQTLASFANIACTIQACGKADNEISNHNFNHDTLVASLPENTQNLTEPTFEDCKDKISNVNITPMVNKTTQVRLKLLTHQSTCRTCVNKNILYFLD